MRKILYFLVCISLLLFSACDIHEWPETTEFVKLRLCLNYETDMTEWKYLYDGTSAIEQGLGETYNNQLECGKIRYIIRTFPISEKQRAMQGYVQEFVFTRDITEGYNHEMTLDLLPGNYEVMVWSDFVENENDTYFYHADNFVEIVLHGDHVGNTDYRDTFCGRNSFSLSAHSDYQIDNTITIIMKRPLAKFEIVANDLLEFIDVNSRDLSLYKTKIQYVGFMPNTYSLFAGRPVASSTGEMFKSSLIKLTDTEVSMGFDYVFVSEKGSTVTVRIGIYDNEDRMVSMSEPITIPVKLDHHTLLSGKFLMQSTSKGVEIDPNWGGDYNIIL